MLRPYNSVRIVRRHHPALAPARRALLIQYHVDREPVQPRAERAFAAKRAELVPQAYEYILRALLRITAVAGETQAESVDTAGVQAI